MSLLKNKNIVIIGGTTGLGLSAAKAFVANEANVLVVGRHAETVDDAKKILPLQLLAMLQMKTLQ
jgi:NAD(P)-dependent dehydrogenase (short-subunit alcohol dehydrogenase family)